MDVDEEIQPDEDENSHLSMGVMSDIHEDEADQCMNSEEEQQLNDNSNSLDNRTDNQLLSNEVNEIDDAIETSQLPSSPVMGSNFEGFQSENMTVNQKGSESNPDEKYEIEDIQMESSNMSPKLDDENTRMSTDESSSSDTDIESSSSDISMPSEREMHSPLIDNEASVIELNNLSKEITFNSTTKLNDNLKPGCKSSNIKLQDSKVSQIKENIKISQIKKITALDHALLEKENDSSTFKHGDGSSLLEEKITENVHTSENSKDTYLNTNQALEISEKMDDNIVENSGLDIHSAEKQSNQDQILCKLNNKNECNDIDEKPCFNENENSFHLPNVSSIISDEIPTNKDKLNENSELLSKREKLSPCENENIQEKEGIIKKQSELKDKKNSDSGKLQNESINKENIPTIKNTIVFEKFEIQEKESNISTVLSSNENINNDSKIVVESGSLNLLIKPVEENESSDDNEISNTNKINDNLSAKDNLLIDSNEDKDSLSNLRSIKAIQKLDKDNSNNKIKDSVQELKNRDLSKEKDATLQREVDQPKGKIEDNVKPFDEYSDKISDEAVKLSMEEEINSSKNSEGSEDFIEKVKEIVIDEDKKNTSVLNENSDIETEKSKEIIMDNEFKEKRSDKSSNVGEEAVQLKMVEEGKKDSKTLGECLDDLSVENKEPDLVIGAEIDLNVLEKDAKAFINETIEDVIDKETINETKVSDECSENIVRVGKSILIEEMEDNSKILSKNSDCTHEETEDINKDVMILNECSNFAEVQIKDVTEIVNKPQSNSLDSDLQKHSKNEQKEKTDRDIDTDSDSYVDISDYLINLNKKDYITSPDLISDDSMSNMYEENNETKRGKSTNAKSPTELKLKSLENDKNQIAQNPLVHDSTGETLEIENKVVLKETSDNSDSLELTSENENCFEVIDEVTEEDTKKKERKPITTEGLAKPSTKNTKNIFSEVPGKEIEDGSFTRVVIVGDSFISNFSKMWPESCKIKPYFLYKNNITLIQILHSKIQDHVYLNNSEKIFVLFICGLHELSFYSTYKFHGCRSTHAPFKYISKVKNDPHTLNRYTKEMTILKQKLEKCNGVFVAFSYLPVIDTALISHALSELSRSKNFNCSCNFSLGTSSAAESTNSICNINRNIFYRNLNEIKVNGIFEFSPVNITYFMDCWCMYSKELKLKENSDILSLSYLLDQYVYAEVDVKPNIRISESSSCLPAYLHTKTSNKSKILIIGDSWIKSIADMWDKKLDAKPYFYCKDGLTLNCIQKVVTSITRTGEKLLVIAAIPSGEFLTISQFSECKDHSKLEYPVPNVLLLKDPFAYAEYVIKKLDLLSLNVQCSGGTKIIFLTCYPALFKNYYKCLYKKHIKNLSSHVNSKSLENVHDCSEFETKVENCFKKVNKHAAALNKELGIPTCNIFSLMKKLSTNDRPVFPTEAKLVSHNVQKKVLQLFEKYVCSLYNENIFIAKDMGKIDEKNAKKESISDVILKNAEIKVKIENKSAEKHNKSNSEEISERSRIVVYKEKKKKPSILDKNLAHSTEDKLRKDPKKLFNKFDESLNEDVNYHSKSSRLDYRRHDSNKSYHHSNEEYSHQNDHHGTASDRYEPLSKYSRDLAFHVRNRSFTRSRSKDRKRSRSIGRRYSRDRKYIRSRSKDRTLGKNKNRDIKRSRSRSKNRKKRRISRSRSRSPSKKRTRRSRSPYRKAQRSKHNYSSKNDRSYRSKSRSKSQNRSSNKPEFSRELNSIEKNALAALWESHSREREMYLKHPENHPDHDRVKRMWLDIMNMQGLNTFDPSVLQFWWEYWLKKMEEIMKASWEEKKLNCLAVLSSKRKTSKSPILSDSSSSDSDYEKHSKMKKKSKSKKSKSKKKSRKRSPSRSKEKEKTEISDNLPTSMDEMEKLLQEFVKKNSKNYEGTSSKLHPVEKAVSKSSASKGSEVLDIFSILCQIQDKFGALGMSLTVLRQKAIECVNNNLSPYNCIDEDAKMLLDLISDKIKKMLQNSEFTLVQRTIFQEALDRLVPFLESFEKSKESSIDIESLAKATLGLQVSEVVNFIKANLEYKGHKDMSQENLMDLYMKVKNYQAKILDFSGPSSSRASSFFS